MADFAKVTVKFTRGQPYRDCIVMVDGKLLPVARFEITAGAGAVGELVLYIVMDEDLVDVEVDR